MTANQASDAISAAMSTRVYREIADEYRAARVDIAPALQHVESVLMSRPPGITEDQFVTLIAVLLRAFLKKATRKEPRTLFEKLIRKIFG